MVLYAHPVEESYGAALHTAAVKRLTERGHDVDDCDLYAEKFDPVLSRDERLTYHDETINRKPVAGYVERLLAAEALVLIYPVWNYGYPAILKGFFDRVFMPGVSFRMENGKVAPALNNISRLTTVTTYGGSRALTILAGDPPRKIVKRVLRRTIKPGAKLAYLAQYDMNRSTDEALGKFLKRVDTHFRRW